MFEKYLYLLCIQLKQTKNYEISLLYCAHVLAFLCFILVPVNASTFAGQKKAQENDISTFSEIQAFESNLIWLEFSSAAALVSYIVSYSSGSRIRCMCSIVWRCVKDSRATRQQEIRKIRLVNTHI